MSFPQFAVVKKIMMPQLGLHLYFLIVALFYCMTTLTSYYITGPIEVNAVVGITQPEIPLSCCLVL